MSGYTVFQSDELPWEKREGDDPRHRAALSDALTRSRANLHRMPPGSRGKRHRDLGQEELFVVLEGTLTVHLGDPPERHDIRQGGVLVVESGTVLQLSNRSGADTVVFAYGAPPVVGDSEFFSPVD